MPVEKSDLKFYLTGSLPLIAQDSASQSIGGFPSLTEVFPNTALQSDISTNGTTFDVSALFSPTKYILVDDEIMQVNNSTLTRAELSTSAKMHLSGTTVFDLSDKPLFNNSLNADGKQYRCIAVTNTNDSDPFYDIGFYFKSVSALSDSIFKMAIEIPRTEVVYGEASSGSIISVIDRELEDSFEEGDFVGNVLIMTSGDNVNIGRQITTSDPSSGTFTFVQALPYPVIEGDTYRIESGPAQRSSSGLIAPTTNTNFVSEFDLANGRSNSQSIDFSGIRQNVTDLYPNETVYVWIERTIENNAEVSTDDRVIFSVIYKK